jgi:hypothetical protein
MDNDFGFTPELGSPAFEQPGMIAAEIAVAIKIFLIILLFIDAVKIKDIALFYLSEVHYLIL